MKKVSNYLCLVLISVLFIGSIILYVNDIRVLSIASESMHPSIPKGSIIFVAKEPFSNIVKEDVIVYRILNSDIVITHRVVDVDVEEEMVLCKGDANEENDPYYIAYAEQYEGSVLFSLPYIGSMILFGKEYFSILFVIGMSAFAYIVFFSHKIPIKI